MRKSKFSTRSRLAFAGLTTGAVVAAVLVAPSAAFAATVPTPAAGPAGSTVTVVDSTTSFTAATTVTAELTTAVSCPGFYATVSATVVAATGVTKVDASTVTLVVPSTIAVGTNGIAKSYNICFYVGATGTSAVIPTVSLPAFTVTAALTLSASSGPSGGGNPLTVTAPVASPVFTTATATFSTVFSPTACPAAYAIPSGGAAATATKTSATVANLVVPAGVLGTGGPPTPYNVCFYAGSATGALLAVTTYTVSLPPVTLSSSVGPSGGGNGITVTSTANILTGVTAPGAAFTTAAQCPTTYPAASSYVLNTTAGVILAAGGTVRKLANNRFAVTIPALALIGSAATVYQACFYNGSTLSTSTILAAAPYISTTVPTPTGITPSAGPALGGSTITVTGTDFPTTMGSITATLGGTPLNNIIPISPTAFTAVTPPHSVDTDVPLVITTAAGTRSLQEAYSFTNALQVMPNTAPNTTASIDVDVQGVGFQTKAFGSHGTSGLARMFLVDGVYNGITNTVNRSRGPVAECSNVLVISDNELICALQLNRRLNAAGSALFDPATYTNTFTTDLGSTIGSRVITSVGGTFSPNDIGQPLVETVPGTNMPVGVTIAAVLSPSRALISANALATTATFTAVAGGAVHVLTTMVTYAALSTTVTAPAGSFTSADVGRVISVANVPAGTTITAVAAGGAGATLSAASTVLGTAVTATLYAAAPVLNGAYNLTYVSNGDLDAPTTDVDFNQSVISSGSTFTVAPF
jgi:hypothetical protein